MTRILAFGDTQIGVPSVSLDEQRKVLDRIVEIALEHKVDLVIHGGDVFEGPVVLPEHLRLFIDATEPLRDQGIDLLVLRGNGRHDMATRSVHGIDVLREITGIFVSDRPSTVLLPTVSIATLPWVQPGHLLAQLDGQASHDQVAEVTARMLIDIATDLRGRMGDRLPTVLAAHWAISGAKLPSGLPVEEMREPVLDWAALNEIGYDAIIGAHIHEPQRLDRMELGDTTLGVVVGSPQQLNHGEKGEHGCWLVDTDDIANAATFIPIESQRFVTLDWSHSEDPAVYEEILHGDFSLSPSVPGNIIRVRYTATEDEARRIDHYALRSALISAGAARVTIEPQIERSARVRAEAITDQLGPVEALVAYCGANDVGAEMQHRMVGRLQDWMTTT